MKSVNKLCQFLRDSGARDEQPNGRGNVVWRINLSDERYLVDFADDFTAEGWLQFDTDQDAHYFGFWVNPRTLTTLTYCEGDWVVVDCASADTYRAEMMHAIEFYDEGFIAKTIDAQGNLTTYCQDRAKFLEV